MPIPSQSVAVRTKEVAKVLCFQKKGENGCGLRI